MILLIDILKMERINPDFLVCKIILLHFFLPMLWIKMKMTHACVNKKKKKKKAREKEHIVRSTLESVKRNMSVILLNTKS